MSVWDQVRRAELEHLVTEVKQHGSALVLTGTTTPEGWPFVAIIAVGKPGNELAVELALDFHRAMVAVGAPVAQAAAPNST